MATEPTSVSKPGEIVRQEFGATITETRGETAITAAAATARSLVEARFIMALQRPRDWDDVRTKLLRAIERPGYAGRHGEKGKPGEAWYHKPVGEGVEGFTIRFAEEAARTMGNIDIRPMVTYEDREKRLVDVMVLDLESNLAYTASVVVPKTVERSYLKKDEEAIRTRINSKGKPVYTREATEDEVAQRQANESSKMIRNEVLRLLPGDVQAVCRARILEIRFGDAATNPDGVRTEIVDAFAKLNVKATALKRYLDHDLDEASPAELSKLRDAYKAIQKGETTWGQVLATELAGRGEGVPTEEAKPGLDGLTEKLKNAEAVRAASPGGPGDTPSKTVESGQTAAPDVGAPPGGKGPAAREPGSDDDDETPSAAAPAGCDHPSVPPSKVAALPAGKALICPDCGEELRSEAKPKPAKRGQQRRLEE